MYINGLEQKGVTEIGRIRPIRKMRPVTRPCTEDDQY